MMSRRAGARLLVARTHLDRGLAIGDRQALMRARDDYRSLGLERRVAGIEREMIVPSSEAHNEFTPGGDVWTLTFNGRVARVRDSKGVRDIARLLAQPGREIAALDLSTPAGAATYRGDLGETVDAQARASYKQRLVDLEAELDEADLSGDGEHSARLEAERDALLEQLAGAYGLGGRARRTGDPAERARTAVTARIRDAIRRISKLHPDLGRHLERSVRTGTFCVYDPDRPISWKL